MNWNDCVVITWLLPTGRSIVDIRHDQNVFITYSGWGQLTKNLSSSLFYWLLSSLQNILLGRTLQSAILTHSWFYNTVWTSGQKVRHWSEITERTRLKWSVSDLFVGVWSSYLIVEFGYTNKRGGRIVSKGHELMHHFQSNKLRLRLKQVVWWICDHIPNDAVQ